MEKVILMGLCLPHVHDFEESLAELASLAEACDLQAVATLTQHADKPTSNFYIGSGKVEEIKEALAKYECETVVFDQELSPTHIRNLEDALEAKVMDRTMLILEIFSRRARTPVSMLQVTLAKSQYMLPRLTGSRDDLSGQGGGRGSIGGAGEQKLETDRRVLRNNIIRCRKSLSVIVTQRRAQRTHRMSNDEYTVAIVGYTNVGKSTLMNQLMTRSMKKAKKKVFEKDMLFATLETAARQIVLPQNRPILIVDTVGFVRHMPTHLIEAFKSTLEEIAEADLILHVVDGSSAEQVLQMEVVQKVLNDLGASEIPVIYVRNKMDKSTIPNDKWDHPRVDISAKTGEGIPMLISEIKDHMAHLYEDVILVFPFERADLYSILKRIADIHEEDIGRETITVDASVPKKDLPLFSAYIVDKPRKIHKNAA